MHVVLVEPRFPTNQKLFVRALAELGVTVTAIGEGSKSSLDHELRHWLRHYEEVSNVTSEAELTRAMRFITSHAHVDRIEATVEAHIMAVAKVREAFGVPGTSVRTAWLCRDKPAMKEALRQGGVPCARSTAAASIAEIIAFAEEVGFPLIVKPRDGAGASGAARVDSVRDIEIAALNLHVDKGRSVAVEEFLEGHEGFYDTLTQRGEVVHEFVSHYYPNVLEAMRTRWISPQIVATNRVDMGSSYDAVKALGRRVIEVLGIESSATHMEWFYGPKGLKFSEIGCRPPGVKAWDLYNVGNDMDLYREWARAICGLPPAQRPSRRYAAGMVALRPDRDGVIAGYEGVDAIANAFGPHLFDWYLPSEGHPTQPVEAGFMANAWVRMKHENYDELRRMLDLVGQTIKVRAR